MTGTSAGSSALRAPIGKSLPRPNARRLLEGRGRYVDDLTLPRMLHVAFLRSPYAHARIAKIDIAEALDAPGVAGVYRGRDIAAICRPWRGVLDHFPGMKSAPQYPLAIDRVTWQGEPVVAVVARSRAEAEDAAERVVVDYEELPAVTDPETALDPATPVIHPELGDNLCFGLRLDAGDVDRAFAEASVVVEETFRFGRHTAVTLEPRAILADWNPAERRLTVWQGAQTPYQMRDVYARHFDIPEEKVQVIAPDVGGSFGMKLHVYGDEVATVALAILLARPVKFVADRLESFVSDIHARDHRVRARMAVGGDGRILALEVDDLTGIGPYSVYPRTSAVEGNQVVRLCGAPYGVENYRARLAVVFQNKNVMCQYRAVGHPIAFAVTEGLADLAARRLDMDPAEFRRRNYIPADAWPHRTATGYTFEKLSLHACLDRLLREMDYAGKRAEQRELRARGIHRGIGLCTFVEITTPGPAFYGVGGARISAQDGCALTLEPSGSVRCAISVTEQGQGTEAAMAQVVAAGLGVPPESVRVITGDTDATPYGGATWASRGAGIGGEAALRAARKLRRNLLELAGRILQKDPDVLDIVDGRVVDRASGTEHLTLAEVGRIGYFRPDTLPPDFQPQLSATDHFVPRGQPFAFTNGIHAAWVEVDTDTGLVRLLGFWVVEDCGTPINPMLIDEQIRGGVVQGIGAALFEECLYDANGQLLNGSLADYPVPLATEMPDIHVAHEVTPTAHTELGAKGVGEAGTAGACGAVLNAINDALAPLGARIATLPATPERILRALGRLEAEASE